MRELKRLRSSEEGLEMEMEMELESESYGKRGGVSRDSDSARSNHRSNRYHHYHSSSARYDRTGTAAAAAAAAAAVEERDDTSRPFRRRSDYKSSRGFDHRRKGFDSRYQHHSHQNHHRRHHHRQHRDFSPSASASASSSSPGDRGGGVRMGVGGGEKSGYARIHRSESFSGPPPRRSEFPKGFRSDRNQPWREGSVSSSWRRYGNVGPGGRDFEFEGGGGKSSSDSISLSWGGGGGRTRSPFLEDRSTPIRSPRASLDAKAIPAPSRDSQIDRSKTTHVNKTEEVQVVENASTAATTAATGCGEMEEGELEPELHQQQQRRVSGPESESESAEALVQPPVTAAEETAEETTTENLVKSPSEDGKELDKESASQPKAGLLGAEPSMECSSQGKLEAQQPPKVAEKDNGGGRAPNETLGSPKKIISGMKCHEDELITVDAKVECCRDGICDVEVKENTTADGCLPSVEKEGEGKDCNDKDPVIEAEGTLIPQTTQMEVSGVKAILKLNPVTDEPSQSVMDKGKGLVLLPPHIDGSTGCEASGVDSGSNKLVTCRNSEIEDGSNTRGFDLFPSPMVKKPGRKGTSDAERLKDEMIFLEPLDLTLSLPNVLLPASSCALNPAPASPNHAMSVQSLSNTLCTDSNGFTASMSFSGSQLIIHNPSCSLTHNSLDNYEHSVGSHPIFQGVDQACQSTWQGKSANDPKKIDIPPCQRISMNGNGSLPQHHASQGIINGQIVQGQHLRVSETSSKAAPSLDQQLSFSRQLSGVRGRHYSAVGSPSQSAGSYETGSEYNKDQKKQVKQKICGIMMNRSCSQKGNEQVLRGESDFVEAMISMIVCEPVYVTNRRFHEMTEQATACLRESISEFLANPSKQRQRSAIQKALQMRSDFNLDILLKCPQVLLEVLVALKTGLGGFLQQHKTSTSHLAEIFLDLRCRNLNCRRLLPVDECECKICAQKTGFCSSCMCLVCSNFDLAFNTCSWVGCDICLHWCHTDCALQKSLIRNGQNVTEGEGPSEMQFHCVACGQPSEMYGFVKEVFQKFAKIWPVETLSRELEYVRRIFWASKDMKGRQLHDMADKMLAKLINGSELPTVYNLIWHFLSESGPSNSCTIISEKELGEGSNGVDGRGKEAMQHDLVSLQKAPQLESTGKEQGEGSNGIDGWGKEAMCHDLIYSENAPQLDRTACIPPWFDSGRIEKCNVNSNLQHHVLKEPVFDELESIVRIKQAEAKMFQTRADDAKREAEELKRIATAKNEKIDEEFRNRIMKLRLIEAEEMRKQKLEQLQAFERAHQDYFNMKTRMEVDIKDLLLKMEATKQKLSL